MSWRDRLWIGFHHIRGRLVESILVIAATAVGVALVAATIAFIGAYRDQTDYLLSHPSYRELVVEVTGNESELDEPVRAYDPQASREVSLGIDDVDLALRSATAVTHGYLADRVTLSTRTPGPMFAARAARFLRSAVDTDAASSSQPSLGAEPRPDAAPQDAENGAGSAAPGDAERGAPGEAGGGALGDDQEARNEARRALRDLLEPDPDVVTDLPLESIGAVRVTTGYFPAYGLEAARGSLFTEDDVESGNTVAVLGARLAETLFPESDPVGTKVRLNLQTHTIIGVLEDSSLTQIESGASFNDLALVPHGEARVSFGGNTVRLPRTTRTLHFAVTDSTELRAATDQLQTHFDGEFGDGAVRIRAPVEQVRIEREKHGRVLTLIMFLAAAGLFIASINLFNLMLMRVIRRTKSVGISRALGASRRDVFRQFLHEAAIMSVVGAAIGFAASPVVYRMLSGSLVASLAPPSITSWIALIVGAAGAFVFSVLFGVWPARQAARIDASLAIRTE